jgi:TonB family protein
MKYLLSVFVAAFLVGCAVPSSDSPLMPSDSRWKKFSAHLDPMKSAVQREWERIIITERLAPSRDAVVEVAFILDASGRVGRIKAVSGSPDEATSKASVAAITNLSPFPPWSADMKAVLGVEQELRFSFVYRSTSIRDVPAKLPNKAPEPTP